MDGLLRNQWTVSFGISGRFAPESVDGFPRIMQIQSLYVWPVNDPLAVIDLYDLRSLIENTLFRELKQGWFVPEAFPQEDR